MKKILLCLIKFYQKNISPQKPKCCRYMPSCSAYTLEAIEIHGAFKGTLLGILRILRCSPLFKGGYDPVPEKKTKKYKKINYGK